MAIAQSKLDKKQIHTILSAKGLKGEILETTTAELAQEASTNVLSASQGKATGSTLGLGNAIKGLGESIKSFATSHPLLLTITAVVGAIYVAKKAYDYFNVTVEESNEILKKANEKYEETASQLESLQDKLKTTKDRIDELNAKENLSLVEQQELDKLIQQNNELERELRIKEKIKDIEQENVNKAAKDYFYKDVSDKSTSTTNDSETLLDKFNKVIEEQKDRKAQIDALQKEYDQLELEYKEAKESGNYDKRYEITNRRLQVKNNLKSSNDFYEQQEKWLTDTYKDFIENDDNVTNLKLLEDLNSAYNNYDKYLDEAAWKTKQIEGILSKTSFENVENKLINMGKAGTLSLESIEAQFPELIEWLEKAGISVDEFYQHIMNKVNPDAVNFDEVRRQMQKQIFGSNGVNSSYEAKLWNQINSNEALDIYQKLLSDNDTTYWTSEDWVKKIVSEMQKTLDTTNETLDWSGFLSKSFGDSTGKELLGEYENTINSLSSWLEKIESESGLNYTDIVKLKQEFPGLADNIEITRDDLIALSDNALENFFAKAKNPPENLKEWLINLRDESLNATYHVLTMSEAISALDTNSRLLSDVDSQIAESGRISDDTLKAIIASYPKMAEAVAKYRTGKLGNQDIWKILEDYYNQDVENYENAIQAKQWHDSGYYNKVIDQNGERLNELAEMYKVDISHCQTAADAKFQIDQKLLQSLSSMWGEYYAIQRDPMTGLYKVIEKNDTEQIASMGIDPDEIASKYAGYADMLNQLQVNIEGLGWETYSKNNGSSTSSSTQSTAETFDWLEVKINECTKALERFTTVRENAFDTYDIRGNALTNQIAQTKELLSLQETAARKYEEHADSFGLSDHYKKLVQSGAIHIEPVDNETTKEQIQNYETWYNKAVQCRQEADKLKTSLSELAKTKFEMITSQFENVISVLEKRTDSINSAISLTEAKGYAVSTKYYEALINDETENIKLLERERDKLTSSLNEAVNTGRIQEGSEAWCDMYSSIQDVNGAIEDSNVSLVGFQNTIRELKWDSFDRLQDSISQIVTESDFIRDLLSNEDIFDDNGYMYASGITTAGQHSVNYNVLMRQADEYGNEYKSVMAELAKDPNNQTLIDRTRELIQAQRDAIQSAQDEKQALIELAREGIQKEIDAMQRLVDTKKEMLDADTSLYEYEQNIAEQADNIALIEKQLAARQGDNSEENRKVLQQLNKDLADAEKKLQETEYDHWKSDQQNMLDNMMSDYEETQNERMKQSDMLFNNMISTINSNSSLINDVINNATSEVGYQITSEMGRIWSNNGIYQDTVSNYVNGADNRVNAVIDSIRTQQKENQGVLDKNAENTINNIQPIGDKIDDLKKSLLDAMNGIKTSNTNMSANTLTTNSTTSGSSDSTSTSGSANGSGKSKPGVGDQVYASGRWYTSSTGNETGIDVSELIGKVDFFKVLMVREGSAHPYFIQAYKNGKAQGGNGWVNLDQLAGYKNGIRNVTKDQYAWTNEDSIEGIYRTSDGAIFTPLGENDMVFTNEQMQRLWEISKTGVIPNVINGIPKLDIPTVANNNTTIGDVKQEVHINLPNVTDPASFRNAIKSDKALRSQIQSLVLDPLTGKNSFGYKRY